ncbi:DUF3263 domain-containing protein [Serinicoccus sediminis]|uniref:DUF3263 domain-containing protein n=1 Tax=Serinicoccus sediminis TaxID=2306021 RepID=UPI0010220B03|nr:DUF3263 domain-containing protein [Serinicoccus sediminis]
MTTDGHQPLSERDRAIIRAAAGTHRDASEELAALTYASGMSLAKTWQRLAELMADQEAWEAEPVAMDLLQRRRRATGARGRRRSTSGA